MSQIVGVPVSVNPDAFEVRIPTLGDDASIEEALKVYHFGIDNYTNQPLQTNPPVGIASHLRKITNDITAINLELDGLPALYVEQISSTASPNIITAQAVGVTPLRIDGITSQTAPLISFFNSTSVELGKITAAGTLDIFANLKIGSTIATSPSIDDNTTKIATTAWVLGQVSSTNPLMNGSAEVGTSLRFARSDHRHPSDTSKLDSSTTSTQGGYFGDIFLYDDNTPSHYLQITNSANLSALRTLSINVNDANRIVSLSGDITLANNFTTSGNFALTLTTTASTNVTLPTSGTLATTGNLSQFASTTSAQLAGVISDEVGTDKLVFNTSPTFVTSLITSSASFDLFNTTATTLNFAGAATALTIGATTGTTTIRNASTVVTGDLAVNGGDITSSSTTFNLLDSTVTTFNMALAGTNITIGATTGTTTIRNANTVVTGDLAINGGDLTSTSTSFNILGSGVNSITIGSGSTNVSIPGNLTVTGTTIYTSTTTTQYAGMMISLGTGSKTTDNNRDRGVLFDYNNSGAKTGFFGYDDSTGKFTFIPDATNTRTVISATGTVGSISGSGPWTATVSVTSTSGFSVGGTIEATNGTGSLYGGIPNNVIINSIVANTSITYTVSGGTATTPTAGTVTNVGYPSDVISGTKGTVDANLEWADVLSKPSPVITLAGDLSGSVTLTSLANGTLTATIAANSVELGTDTTGNYVASVSGTDGVTITGTGEGAAVTIVNSDKGSSQNIFKNITDGTNTAAADSNNDTFTLTAGSGVSITVNATTDAATFANTGVLSVNGSTGAVTGIATTGGNLSQFAATTSAQLAGVLSDETGFSTGALAVFNISPSISTSITTGSTSFDLLNTTATTINLGGAATAINMGATTGTVTVAGNLVVNGTTTTVNSSTLVVNDKNIEIGSVQSGVISTTGTVGSISGTGPWTATITGMTDAAGLVVGSTITATAGTGSLGTGGVYSVTAINSNTSITFSATGGTTPVAGTITNITGSAASNATADGGGITLKGATDKTLNWINSTASWTSSEDFNLVSTKVYRINGTSVLSATTLGTGVTASSLTSVGTITTGTWSASFGAVSGANLTNLTANNLSGTIPSAVLGNSSHFIGTTSVALNRASANQALTGISSVAFPGATSGTATLQAQATAGTPTLSLPTVNGTLIGTGDTGTVSTAMIANSNVTYAKIQNVSAQYRVLGRITAAAGVVEEVTPDNLVTILGQATVTTSRQGTGAIVLANSPTLTGTPAAPTATAGTNTTQIATTAFVTTAVSSIVGGASYQTTAPSTPVLGQIWVDSDEVVTSLNSNDFLLKSGGTMTGNLVVNGTFSAEQFMIVSLSDETTNITTGTAKLIWRAPHAMTLTQIPRASLSTASTSGLVTVDINESGSSVLGANKLSIDANEKTSTTAATATTLADTAIADDAEITFDIDAAGTGAKGLKVIIYYKRA